MTLYEIDSTLMQLIEKGFSDNCVDFETGEIDEAKVQEFLSDLPMEREKKLEAYGLIIKNFTAEAEAIKEEEKKLEERRKAKEKTVERLKQNITLSMTAFGDLKFETAKVCFNLRKSKSIEVESGVKLPEKYITVKVTETPNKTELKKALVNGEVIEGVSLVEKQNLQIK